MSEQPDTHPSDGAFAKFYGGPASEFENDGESPTEITFADVWLRARDACRAGWEARSADLAPWTPSARVLGELEFFVREYERLVPDKAHPVAQAHVKRAHEALEQARFPVAPGVLDEAWATLKMLRACSCVHGFARALDCDQCGPLQLASFASERKATS